MLTIKDAVAVITGGASGIGLAMAKYWAQNGGKLVLGDVAEEPLERRTDLGAAVDRVTKPALGSEQPGGSPCYRFSN